VTKDGPPLLSSYWILVLLYLNGRTISSHSLFYWTSTIHLTNLPVTFRRTSILVLQNHINISPRMLQALRPSQFTLLDSFTIDRRSVYDFHRVGMYLTLRPIQTSVFLHFEIASVYSYILIMEANGMHYVSYLFEKVFYMFRTSTLSIIRGISTLYTPSRYLSCYFCWRLLAWSGWNSDEYRGWPRGKGQYSGRS